MLDHDAYVWCQDHTSSSKRLLAPSKKSGLISAQPMVLSTGSEKNRQQHSPLSKPSYNELAGVLMVFHHVARTNLFILFEVPMILPE